MLKLDNNLLTELGLGTLPEEQKKAMLQHIYETLELRVGTDLANQMTDQQLEEFEKFIDDGGDANQSQALQWLEANLPNYKDVVNRVFEELKTEIKNMAPQIMASAPQPAADPGAYAQTPPAPQAQPATLPPQQQSQTAYQQPQQTPPVYPQQPGGAQVYQFPQQQPPAGPGASQQPYPPYGNDQQRAA
jgi:hypothetical protein